MKVQCTECEWIGDGADLLAAPHPFRQGMMLEGCPNCREVNVFLDWSEPQRPPTVTEHIETLAEEIAEMAEVIALVARKVRERTIDKG